MKKVKLLISAASLVAIFMIVLLTGCGPDIPYRSAPEPQGNLVPNVMGMNYTDAVAVLEAADFEVTAVGADASTILPHTDHDRTVMQGQVFRVNDETFPNYSDSHSILTGLSRVAPEGRIVLTFATEDYIFVPPEPEPEQETDPEQEAEPVPEPEQDVKQDYDSEYEPELEYEPSVELDESESEPDVSNGDSELIGTWNWMGMPYYVFEEDGSGTMGIALMNMSIRWWSPGQGLLSVCNTPDSCGNNCLVPQEWYYEISNNQLTITSRQVAGLSYTYNRSN